MKNKKLIVAVGLLSSLLITGVAVSQVVSSLNALKSAEEEKRVRAYTELANNRWEQIQQLIENVKSEEGDVYQNGTWQLSVYLLAQHRDAEAVDALSSQLMRLPIRTSRIISLEGRSYQYSYPCAEALVKIGEPSDVVPKMEAKILAHEMRRNENWLLG